MQKNKMITKFQKTQISNLMVETIKKDIKNLHLGVYPPDGKIRVSVPLRTNDETIRLFVLSKKPWIKKQQSKFSSQQRQTKREYVSGESHYLFGKRYRLNLIHSNRPNIKIRKKTFLDLYVKLGTKTKQKEAIFDQFYRSELRSIIPGMLKKWQKEIDVPIIEVGIRKMKTKWGTCNHENKRILLNLELAKKPLHCIDYVFVHELTHLVEKKHSDKFMKILDSIMPKWQSYKDELNHGILGYSTWKL